MNESTPFDANTFTIRSTRRRVFSHPVAFLHDLRATVTENAREFRSFARGGVECDDQTD
jgi:hypothetical protein